MTRMLALATALLALAQTTVAQTAAQPALPPPATAAPAATAPAAPAAATPAAAAPAAAAPAAAAPAAAAPAATAPATAQPEPATAQPAPPPAQPQPVAAAPAPAPQPRQRRGKLFTWGSVGTTFAYGETYGSANLGVGYFLIPSGITPNVEASYAFGNTPTLWALRPGVIWYTSLPFRPYVGVHYTRWFVSGDLPDANAFGGRAGFSLGRVLSLGVTYDRLLDCERNCDTWMPVVSAGLSI
jgi:hypothetical protein